MPLAGPMRCGWEADLRQWMDRLSSPQFAAYGNLFESLSRGTRRTFEDASAALVQAVQSLSDGIEKIRAEALERIPVSDARLEKIGAWASATGFSADTGAFPLPLFDSVTSTAGATPERRSFRLQKVNKGEYTDPPMARRAVNEHEWFARTIGNYVGAFLLRDSLRKISVTDVEAKSPVRYWEYIAAYAERAGRDGRSPLLLLENRTRPGWVREWLSMYPESAERPKDLRAWRDPQARGDAYIGHLNDVAVYLAPSLSPGTSVLMTAESFVSVGFGEFDTGHKVLVEAEEIQGQTSVINLKLSWAPSIEIGPYGCLRLIY